MSAWSADKRVRQKKLEKQTKRAREKKILNSLSGQQTTCSQTTADWDSATQEFVLHTVLLRTKPLKIGSVKGTRRNWVLSLRIYVLTGCHMAHTRSFCNCGTAKVPTVRLVAFGCDCLGNCFGTYLVLFFSFPVVFLFSFPLFPFPLFIHSRHASLDRWVVDAGHSH